jgi:hypothetical protein
MLPASTGYGWNGTRYIDLETGRFVSSSTVRNALEKVMQASAARMNAAALQLTEGTITLAEWQTIMMQQIKLSHVAAGAAANGGWAQMTQVEWGAVGNLVKEQYQFLRNFANQIAEGTQAIDGRLLMRVEMYGEAARGTYEAMRLRSMMVAGMTQARRILGDADHCDDCLEFAADGWVPIDEVVEIGDSVCTVRCHCEIEYRATTEEAESEEV